MKKVGIGSSVVAATISVASLMAAYTQAETVDSTAKASPNAAGDLVEIVVTAEKRSESVNRVPMSVTALTAAQLTTSGVYSTEDLAKVVPGFSAITSFYGTPVYYLRGVGYYDTSLAARPAVTIYADEAPIPYSAMALGTTLDLERVEVLKGPQGTLFGSNSTGGAINFIAAKPGNTFETGADLSYGRFNDVILSGFVSGPLSDKVGGRLAVLHQGSGNWQKNYVNGTTLGAKDITSFRGTLELKPFDGLRALLTVSGTHDGSDSQVGQLVGHTNNVPQPNVLAFPFAPNNARAAAWGTIYPNGSELSKNNSELQGSLRIDYQATDWMTITSLTSAARYTESFAQNGGGTTLRLSLLDNVGKINSVSEELRASGTLNAEQGHWIVGGNVEHDKTREISTNDLTDNSSGNVFSFLGLPGMDSVPNHLNTTYASYGVFGNIDYNLIEAVTSHLGIRYTDTKTEFEGAPCSAGNMTYPIGIVTVLNFMGSSIAPIAPGSCFVFEPAPGGGFRPTIASSSLDQGSTSWRGGLDWKIMRGTMLYGNVSRGYKAAAVSNIAAVFVNQFVQVPQERLTSYEFGVKTDIIPHTHVNAAVFYYDYLNKQLQGTVNVPIFGAQQAMVSIPKSHIKGAEFDLATKPFAGLTLGLAGTYLQSAVAGDYVGTTALGPTANFNGYSFPNTPKWQGSATAEYDWNFRGDLDAFVGTRLTERSAAYGDFGTNPQLKIPSYALLDAYVGVRTKDSRWSGQLWARNLTNKYYWTSQIAYLDSIVRFAGMPVTYGISVSYRN
jgi:outer membrane receptor protein involved in Fe transport